MRLQIAPSKLLTRILFVPFNAAPNSIVFVGNKICRNGKLRAAIDWNRIKIALEVAAKRLRKFQPNKVSPTDDLSTCLPAVCRDCFCNYNGKIRSSLYHLQQFSFILFSNLRKICFGNCFPYSDVTYILNWFDLIEVEILYWIFF